VGAERAGAERVGAERAGAERAGAERVGAERAGAERAGAERAHAVGRVGCPHWRTKGFRVRVPGVGCRVWACIGARKNVCVRVLV